RHAPRASTPPAPASDVMMSLTERESQALGSIAHGLPGSDPRLASMLGIFSRLTSGEEMPAREKARIRRGRPPARPRRAPRHPRRSRLQAMLVLWAGISAALLTVALTLNTSGPKTCTQSMGTARPSPSTPRHAGASPLMNPRLLAAAFPHRPAVSIDPGCHAGPAHHRELALRPTPGSFRLSIPAPHQQLV